MLRAKAHNRTVPSNWGGTRFLNLLSQWIGTERTKRPVKIDLGDWCTARGGWLRLCEDTA